MAVLPVQYQKSPWYDVVAASGLSRISCGKVREAYADPLDPEHILFLAGDNISTFNFVLPAQIARKGEVLTALSHFVMTNVLHDYLDDMVLPQHGDEESRIWQQWRERHPSIPWERCTLVRKYTPEPYEAIFRRHPGGSIWEEYEKFGTIAGQPVRSGLQKWAQLEAALATPTEKSETDEPLTVKDFLARNPEHGSDILSVLGNAYDTVYEHFRKLGLRILDTKCEYAVDLQGRIVIIDEKFTQDSSRWVLEKNWLETQASGKDPAFMDKEVVRIYTRTIETPFSDKDGKQIIGINGLSGSNPEHIAFVHSLTIPEELSTETSCIYLDLFEKAVGCDLSTYQRDEILLAA